MSAGICKSLVFWALCQEWGERFRAFLFCRKVLRDRIIYFKRMQLRGVKEHVRNA